MIRYVFQQKKRLTPLLLITAVSCSSSFGGKSDEEKIVENDCTKRNAGFECVGNEWVECRDDGSEASRLDCAAQHQVCTSEKGCVVCASDAYQCNGNTVERCNRAGTDWETDHTCDTSKGEQCNVGTCTSACATAEATNSYIGCEYWPTPVANLVDSEFDFAVVVGNPQEQAVQITVSRNGSPLREVTLLPGATEAIRLPWIQAYKTPYATQFGEKAESFSALVPKGAYRLQSSLPVTAYQFSPLEYRIDHDCTSEIFSTTDGQCFSYSNDASLLLPTHTLAGRYIASSERTRAHYCEGLPSPIIKNLSGFVTIVAVSESVTTVKLTLKGRLAHSKDELVSAGVPGDIQTYTLNQGDVLQLASADLSSCVPNGKTVTNCTQIHCLVPDDYDLTGTEIEANHPVMVLGGHTCANLPSNRLACDHLEETIFPLKSWGKSVIVSAVQPVQSEPNIIRILSGENSNTITFDPPSVQGAISLNRGEVFEMESSDDFEVRGTGAILVSQYLVGQNYSSSEFEGEGDPAMSFAIPSEQFRDHYDFLTPTTFSRNFVNIVAPVGATVILSSNAGEETTVSDWRVVGGTNMQTARVSIPGGQHRMTSNTKFGIIVYGYANYTSYMYPGGLDFREINIID